MTAIEHAAGKVAEKAAGAAGKAVGAVTDNKSEFTPLQQSLQHLTGTLAERAATAVADKVGGATERLTEYAEGGGGGGGLLAAVTGAQKLAEGESPMRAAMGAGMASAKDFARSKFEAVKESVTGGGKGKGKGKGGRKASLVNIVEHIDVGVPVELAYNQWTQFADFPKYTKKVEQVEQKSDEEVSWTAKVFWSRRTWESTIIDQVPDEHIIWRSKGAKGYVDGAVTFHELAPSLTRIVVVLEYHPQGLFERTGNLWRAQGRRARLELKHFQRHVMTQSALHPDEVEGWRGEIHDSEVVEESAADTDEEETEDETGYEDEDEEGEDRDERTDTDEERDEERDENADEDSDGGEDEDEAAQRSESTPTPRRRRRTSDSEGGSAAKRKSGERPTARSRRREPTRKASEKQD